MKSGFIEGAVTISPLAGQEIEGLDIEMERVKSYCVEGVTLAEGKAASMFFEIVPSGIVPAPVPLGVFYISRAQATSMTSSEGRFSVCVLPPRAYRLTAGATDPPAHHP